MHFRSCLSFHCRTGVVGIQPQQCKCFTSVQAFQQLEALFQFGVKFLGVGLFGHSHHGAAGARDVHRLGTAEPRHIEDLLRAGHQGHPVGLVELILGGNGQQVVAALAERRRDEGRTGQVIHRILVGDLFGQGRTGGFGQQLVVRHDGREAEALVYIPLDGVDDAVLENAAGQTAQKGRCHIVRVALDGGGQRQQLPGVEHIAQHPVRAQQARDDAGRGRAEAPGHRDGVGLDELEGRHGLADLIEQTLGRAVDQIGLAAGDAGAVRRRDVQMVALFEGHGIIQGHSQAQRIEAGADVGTGGRDGNFYLHRSSLFSRAQASSGRRRSTSFTLPPMASTLRAASARALPSALSTK